MPYALSLKSYDLCFMNPVYLKLSRATAALPVEASRFWGNPALPEGVEYPQYIDDDGCQYPYVFICQINLAELKAFCGEIANPLPSSGLLLFFAKIDHYLGMPAPSGGIMGAISDTEAVKVIHVADLTDLREIVLVDEDDQPMSPHELEITFSHHHDPLNDEDHALFARPDHREWPPGIHPMKTGKSFFRSTPFPARTSILISWTSASSTSSSPPPPSAPPPSPTSAPSSSPPNPPSPNLLYV